MATINFATREISAKVVYLGPTGAGSTTNVEWLHASWPGRRKSALHGISLRENEERSWYFEYLTDGPFEGFSLALQVYCLPGGITAPVHREEVMRGVDGLVLVADARRDRTPGNLQALLDVEQLLQALDLDLSQLAVVIQVNHTDTEDARSLADVVFDLNPFGFPVFAAVARSGLGVHETHAALVEALRQRVRNTIAGQVPGLALSAVHDPQRLTGGEVVRSHVAAIQEREAEEPSIEAPAGPVAPRVVGDGPEIEVPFQPRELLGSHPVEIMGVEIDGDRVRLELAMEHMGGGAARRLTLWLVNRPADTAPLPVRSPAPARPARVEPVFDYLAGEDSAEEEDLPAADLPGVWYGILGVGSGVLIGLLSAYLAGVSS